MSGLQRWLIAGASGLLGVRLGSCLLARGRHVTAHHWQHPLPPSLAPFGLAVDLLDGTDACQRAVEAAAPDVVVNCVGLTNVDQCEREPARAALLNDTHAGRIAAAARAAGVRFVQISTDHLWDGTRSFVSEEVPPRPINVYAKTKAAGESAVARADPEALIVRTNFFGPGLPWRKSINDWLTEELTAGRAINAFSDVFFTPMASDLLSATITELVDRRVTGVLNVAGAERISKYDFALRWARHAGLNSALIRAGSVVDSALAAPRPRDMSLDCSKAAALLGRPMPSFRESLEAFDRAVAAHHS